MAIDYSKKGEWNKLSRKEKVYKKLEELTHSIAFKDIDSTKKLGFEASYIAEQLNISRNNVSKELNCLLNEGKAVKVLGKPVLYFDRISLEARCNIAINNPIIKNVNELKKMICSDSQSYDAENEKAIYDNEDIDKRIYNYSKPKKTIFDSLIGEAESLKNQVKQAKAAILYPPNGLHTLLIGPTGTGKTTFAEVMYRYAIETGRLKSSAPYVIFNCADYAENSQLLISHLFGHVKGAFTGADKEKKGLIDQANGGILFLDEVHRLPPEGQETLFSLMDRGSYRRLGEAENTRKARILIIAATTEDPNAVILSTFLRRIPVIINLPSLNERSLKERMTLICQFFRDESVKIRIPVKVSKEVLKVLLLYKCPGNIGQLKNDIQLICANAFVEYAAERGKYVYVKLSQISQRFKEGLFIIDNKRYELTKYFNLNDFESIVFKGTNEDLNGNLKDVLLYDEYKTEEDFYDSILERAQKFYEEGLSINQIKQNINEQVQNRFYNSSSRLKSRNLTLDKEVLSKIVTPEIVEIIEESLRETSEIFNIPMDTKAIYSLALHMETLIERVRLGQITIYPNIEKTYMEHQQEYIVAEKMKSKLEKKLSIRIPDDEVAFITMFLYSINMKKDQGNIEVLVITHGYATATNMVDVAKTLLGYECIHALDMPLEEKVEVILERAVEIVKKIDKGKGVLLLVDMGSLTTFSEVISERTGIHTRTVKMVSTPMVLEAARKAMMPNMDLNMLVESVKKVSTLIGERIKLNNPLIEKDVDNVQVNYWERLINMLEEVLTFLNVRKASKVLTEVLKKIASHCNKTIDDKLNIKFLFHSSCMIERVIRNETLPYKNFKEIKITKKKLFNIVKDNFTLVEEVFGVTIPDSELAYIVEMIDTHFHTVF